MSKSLRERNQVTIGVVGLVVAALLVFCSLNINMIRGLFGQQSYTAMLSDSGGVRSGDPVRVDGVTVGSVSGIELEGKQVKVTFRAGDVTLGDKTRVEVRSENALGSKYLAVEPGGSGDSETIPLERTDPGYAVSEVLGRLTDNNAEIDVDRLAASFESVSSVLAATPEEFSSALDGVSALSRTISARDAELAALLQRASSVSSVLADRNEQIINLITTGDAVFREIYDRRAQLEVLFEQVGRAADQIVALVEDNRDTIGPALTEIDRLSKLLNDYRDDLGYILQTLPKYGRSLGESVGSGPFFQAYIPNLLDPTGLVDIEKFISTALDPDAPVEPVEPYMDYSPEDEQ